MNHTTDRCSQLRTLHDHLTNEVKNMRESLQRAQQEGISTSAESLNTLRSLQAALNNISRELQKCPPEKSEESATEGEKSTLLRQVKAVLPEQRVRNWFPDSVQRDDEESIVDAMEPR